ncbi:MAG: hypothetical protein AB7L13_21120 [Acidimicrobiia bacterium]
MRPTLTPNAVVVIEHGGTYSGTWASTASDVAVIAVHTSEPVVIENSKLSGPGDLIVTTRSANLTVRNTTATGSRPVENGRPPGRFISTAGGFTNLVVERNTIVGTSGIWAYGYDGNHTATETVSVRFNVARDIDGRRSNGRGQVLMGDEDRQAAQFLQVADARAVPGIEVAWNDVVNTPGASGVEDNINFYRAGGTAASPARIHDNFIHGAYPADAAAQPFSGGGILVGDTSPGAMAGSYVDIDRNVVVATTNHGISVVCGRHNRVRDNRIVASGVLPDGQSIAAQNVGLSIASAKSWGGPCDDFGDNSATGNVIGWQKGTERNDLWTPGCEAGACTNNTALESTITAATEASERSEWQRRLAESGNQVGVSVS